MVQNLIDMRKRLKGAPEYGTVSIVVTDIEGSSGGCYSRTINLAVDSG